VLDADRKISVLSSTRDDAAGEALDKGRSCSGSVIPEDRSSSSARSEGSGCVRFPARIGRRDELDFSFSGVKTSLRYLIEKMTPADVEARTADLCASYQQAVVDALRENAGRVRQREIIFEALGVGGVANNGVLRASMESVARAAGFLFAAQPKHTGDNAGMIAFAAWADSTGVDRASGWDCQSSRGESGQV